MGVKWRTLLRRRVYEPDQLDIGNLKRCLSVWDLTALGLGSSLGVGVYVLVGIAALNLAGPAIVLSFIIAAVASMFAAMCYAELGSRVPKAGSAYTYTYVTMGELVAFIVGWNMILEAVFGTASIARGLSMYVDSMSNNTMSSWLESVVPIYSANLSPYFDFFSFFVVIILGVLLAIGVRESSYVNNMLTVVNIIVIAFIICAGAFKADLSNWSIPPAEVPEGRGVGGFFPYGVWGVLRGAAVCFYGFVGFDSIGSTGEEVRDPQRAIPTSIMLTQGIAFISYAGVATVLTMMMPYYLQETVASVASAFSYAGWDWAWFVVTAGAVIGITASLYGSMFPLPRLLYSMSSDGLMFHWLSRVTANRKAPTIATLVPTAVIALLAAILELNELILMMCVGTLLAYTVVASCVILLRYRSSASSLGWTAKQIFGLGHRFPTKMTSNTINILLLLFMCTCVLCALVTSLWWSLAALVSLHVVAVLLLLVMTVQPQNNEDLAFKTPLVPIIPCLSIYVNIHLMILIKPQTWIRVLIWIAIGIPVYIFCVCYYKQPVDDTLDNDIDLTHAKANGKAPVQIYVVSPTPPDTIGRSNQGGEYENEDEIQVDIQQNIVRIKQPIITEEVIVQHALVAENEEKEAKIIDLLDRVLQAEEESYADMKEQKEEVVNEPQAQETTTHRKSLSELSDTGSDASMGTQGLSKYDVIAQVHREDLPKLTEEEEEKSDKETDTSDNENGEQEEVTAFNDSDANSRTDESGYSDTLDKTALGESTEDLKEEMSIIPVPPPLDENFFASPAFKKSYTISVRPPKRQIEQEEKNKPRESVESNNSNDDTPMVFGSDKQMHFMSKLENIFQNKMANDNDGDTHLKRSNSTGNVAENANSDPVRERPAIFLDLKKEIISREAAQNLRRVAADENKAPRSIHSSIHPSDDEEEKDSSLSREDLKSKLEHIYAVGGPRLSKSRLIKSNSPTPEEASQTDISSVESVPKTPKKEKNDTLKRQKARYGEVLNSLRMMNTDDQV